MDKSIILKGIADNPALMDELKKLFDELDARPLELGLSNQELGERVRAREEVKLVVAKVFSKILEYKTPGVKVEGKHPGR